MKKITLLTVAFFVAMAAQAQFEYAQAPDGESGIISDKFTDTQVFAADDFTLSEQQDINTVTVSGFQEGGNLESLLTGFTLYIYADDGGVPAGDPSSAGDEEVGFDDLTIGSQVEVTKTEEEGSLPNYEFKIDLNGANGGSVSLDAGTYWIVAAPNLNFANGAFPRWNWLASTETSGGVPKLIDVDDNFQAGATSWTDINALTDGGFDALGFSVSSEEANLGLNDAVAQETSIYPNPVGDVLNLQVSNSIQVESAVLYDVTGKATSAQLSDNNTMNTAQLSSGIYILKLNTSEGSVSKKVVKK